MTKLLAILQLFPLILGMIRSIEDMIPVPQSGKDKLNLILDTIQTVYEGEESLRKAFTWDKLAGIVTTVVGRVVALLNALGVFKTSTPVPAT